MNRRKKISGIMICMLIIIMAFVFGAGREAVEKKDESKHNLDNLSKDELIADLYQEIYEKVTQDETLDDMEIMEQMIERLGEHGLTAVDGDNQIDMVNAERAEQFIGQQELGEEGELTVIRLLFPNGFAKYDMRTEDGAVSVSRSYYEYKDGCMENGSNDQYEARAWQYTQEGYLVFEGELFSEEQYALTMSVMSEHVAMRIRPLGEEIRKMNRQYIRPVGYGRNNLFLLDWNEDDFGEIDFQDMFDILYPQVYGKKNPYAERGIGTGVIVHVPAEEFEHVIMTYFQIERRELQRKTIYFPGDNTYGFRTREMGELEYPEIPYPEVADFAENGSGLITMTVNAVYPEKNISKVFSHEVTVRILPEGGFRYVSNHVIPSEKNDTGSWHKDRQSGGESQEESALWVLPQAENCLLTEEEKRDLQELALKAGEEVKEIYRDVEIMEGPSYGSNIKEFTKEQRKEAVSLLGRAGYTSITENCNMENPEQLESFYKDYLDGKEALATVVQVNRDGLLGMITFIYRNGELQTYYVGVRWREGGWPALSDTSVSDVAEIRLTEKGYFIYAYKVIIAHASLRQYWRVKPLSDTCRELTEKYISGLSYVNYNLLIRNWDAGNAGEILMQGMFEDLYRMNTGERLQVENGRIPAETFEQILTTCLPVTTEQLREAYQYEEESDSYIYERITPKAHPPFGEVVEYAENGDGTLTLIVDGVWPDYDSDCAFTNQIVVMPFADGTFRYLSNKIWQKELEIPSEPLLRKSTA